MLDRLAVEDETVFVASVELPSAAGSIRRAALAGDAMRDVCHAYYYHHAPSHPNLANCDVTLSYTKTHVTATIKERPKHEHANPRLPVV